MDSKTSSVPLVPTAQSFVQVATDLTTRVLGARKGVVINTAVEFVGVVCQIVEQTAVQALSQGTPLSGTDKLNLACQIASSVLTAAYTQLPSMITQGAYANALGIVGDLNALIPMIQGVIAVSKMSTQLQQVEAAITAKGCWCF